MSTSPDTERAFDRDVREVSPNDLAAGETLADDVELTGDKEWWIYAAILLLSSAAYGYLLHLELDMPRYYLAVPVLCVVLFVSRWRLIEALIPAAVLGGLSVLGWFSGSRMLVFGQRRQLLILAAVATIAAAVRFQSHAKPASLMIASTRLNYTPTGTHPKRIQRGFAFGHLLTVGLILFAWWFAGYLSEQLNLFSSNPNAYRRAYQMLHQRIGLLPEWYVGVKVLFSLSILLWLMCRVFEYLSLRQADGSVAAMHLRSELWKWNGSEQRMVAKQRLKNENASIHKKKNKTRQTAKQKSLDGEG